MAISKIDSDGIVSGGITADSLNIGQIGGRRNLIINGAMAVDQRLNGSSELKGSGSQYHTDRFTVFSQAASKITAQQVSEAPAGFKNSLQLTVTNAVTLGATDQYMLQQRIEGQNVAHLAFGTASAETVTLSFYVRSSVTGTHSGVLVNGSENRNYPFTYTISAADTWERISVTIVGDTSGTWVTTNAVGMWVKWNLGTGSTYLGTAGAWSGSSYLSGATGSVQLIETGSATFYITGVQLEVGSVATPFEHRSYGEELALCQRYFQRYGQGSSSNRHFLATVAFSSSTDSAFIINLPTSMRAVPTLSFSSLQVLRGGVGYYSGTGTAINSSTPNEGVPINVLRFTQTTGSSGASQGDCGHIACAASTSSRLDLDAEL